MFGTREPKRGCVQEKQNRNLKQASQAWRLERRTAELKARTCILD